MTRNIKRKRDIYQEVTNRLIEKMEAGVAPWRRSWSRYGLARNYATDHIYTGINMILMNMTPHKVPYFMTFNQVKQAGGKIRKGSKAEMVVYFNVYYKDEHDRTLKKHEARKAFEQGQDIQILKFIKYYNVFNIADVEGIDFELPQLELKDNEQIDACDRIILDMPNRPQISEENTDQPYYSPSRDVVNMPGLKQFDSPQAYYATLFHELAHSTGHADRLNREAITNPQGFGSEPYSQEELLAELAASFVCATVNIDYDEITENSAAYLALWLKRLKEDPRFIFKVAADAQKAADYILNRRS